MSILLYIEALEKSHYGWATHQNSAHTHAVLYAKPKATASGFGF